MKKNDILKSVEIIDYTFMGLGVAKLNNFSIFVQYAKVGEIVDIEITKVEKRFAYAKLINKQLSEVKCEHYYDCGSCDLMHLNYLTQVELKQNTLKNLMKKQLIQHQLEPFVKSDVEFGYRNKIAMSIQFFEGKLHIGYYGSNSHKFTNINNCLMVSPKVNELIHKVERLINVIGETSYHYKTGRGNLRHLVIRSSGTETMVMITTNSGKLKNEDYFIDELKKYNVTQIVINTQKSKSRNIIGSKNRIIFGSGTIKMSLNDLEFATLPSGFFQVNREMTEKILKTVSTIIDFKDKSILDAFCGAGTIGLALASDAASITGIEINEEAIKAANLNKELLNISNANFLCDDIENAMNNIEREFDIIIVDPPRSGLNNNMKKFLIEYQSDKLVYISCNPSTLMRDLSELQLYYKLEYIQGFDMFPNTHHIETLVILSKIK